jgi:hypothetical protein
VPAADVQALAADIGCVGQIVDPAEEQRHGRVVGQRLAALGECGLEELPADPVARGGGVEALGAGPHPGQRGAGLLEVGLLGLQVVGAELEVGVGVGVGIGIGVGGWWRG